MSRPNVFKEALTLSLKDRVRVLNAYKDTPNYITLAKQFNCSIMEIKAIHRRGKRKVVREYVKNKTKRHLGIKYVQSGKDTEVAELLEKILYEWFQRAQRHKETGPITNKMLLEKAEEAKMILPIKNFRPNLDWVLKFRQKYEITDLDMTMLMLDDEPKDVDMYEIAMDLVDQNPISSHETSDRFSGEIHSAFDTNKSVQLNDVQNYNSTDDDSRITDLEWEIPPITNDEQARRHLRPLEDYVLLRENYRAIGLISQLEEIFKTTNEK